MTKSLWWELEVEGCGGDPATEEDAMRLEPLKAAPKYAHVRYSN